MKSFKIIFLFVFIFYPLHINAGGKSWERDFKKNPTNRFFIENGKYTFIQASQYLHFIDNQTGNEVWSAEVKDFEEKGIALLLDEGQYILSYDDGLISYNIKTGEINWKSEAKKINQKRYSNYYLTKSGLITIYDKYIFCVDSKSGNELWLKELTLNSDRNQNGMENVFISQTSNGERILLILKKGLLLIDSKTGEDIWKNEKGELTDEKNIEAVSVFGNNALLFYDNDIISFLNLSNGVELFNQKQDIDDIEGYYVVNGLAGKDYLMLSLEDEQLMFNLTDGNLGWKIGDDALEGILTEAMSLENGKYILGHFMKRAMMGSENGTYLIAAKIETSSGNIVYKEKIAWTGFAQSGFIMSLRNTLGDNKRHDFGFVNENLFDGDDIIYIIRGTTGVGSMGNPLTRSGEGEGIVRMNKNSGQILYRAYFDINKDESKHAVHQTNSTKSLLSGNVLLVPGTDRIVAADISSGNILWKHDKDFGLPTNLWINDNAVFVKVGTVQYSTSVDPKKAEVTVKKIWNESPYKLYAFDFNSGSKLWENKFDDDLALGMPVMFDEQKGIIYCSDTENLFAVKLTRDSGGKKEWSFNYDKDGKVGELEKEDCYAIRQKVTTSVDLFSAVINRNLGVSKSYEAEAELVLRAEHRGNHFIIFGPDGFCAVDINGSKLWSNEWDWKSTKVSQPPYFLNSGKIVYMIKGNVVCIDENSGKILWQGKADSDSEALISPDEKSLLTFYKRDVVAFNLND